MGIFDKKPESTSGKDPNTGMPRKSSDFSDVKGGTAGGPTKGSADFSDVTAGASSTAPADTLRTYTVKSGDSLSKIAKRYYGDANKWQRIYEANRDKITDPDLIHPGQEFIIPD